MNEDRIKSDLEAAAERYNEGQYDEAIRLWRQVLEAEPANQKAREGIRMASLLTGDWASTAPATGAAEPAPPAPQDDELQRVAAGIARVRELVEAGRHAEALEGCALLEEIAPDLEEVRRLAEEVRIGSARPQAAEGIATPERHLERARRALAGGDNAAAAEAAQLVLSQDPANMEATGILSLVGDLDEIASSGTGAETGPMPVPVIPAAPPLSRTGPEPAPQGAPAQHPRAAAPSPRSAAPPVKMAASTAGDGRIEGLLASGQQAFDAGRHQDAIEIWSRIFAIDSAHAEAGARIDRAKAAVEEQARQIDDLYYRAVDANEANRFEEALGLFEQVLAISPHHQEARSFIEEIQARQGGLGEPIRVDDAASREAAEEKERRARAEAAEWQAPEQVASVPLAEIRPRQQPPARAAAPSSKATVPAARWPGSAPARRGGGGRLVAGLVGMVAVGAVAVGGWLWLGADGGSMPEARATVPVPVTRPVPAPSKSDAGGAQAPISKAGAAPIQVVPGNAPPEAPQPSQPEPAAVVKDPGSLEREGRQFYQQRRWAEAVLTLREALAADPVAFDSQAILDKAMMELEKQARIERDLAAAAKAFDENDFALTLQKLYRLQQDHPEMRILETYIRNAWFDWGVSLLKDGNPDEAVDRFSEVIGLSGGDNEAAKAMEFAKRYRGRQRDTVYDAFVSRLAPRPLDQR